MAEKFFFRRAETLWPSSRHHDLSPMLLLLQAELKLFSRQERNGARLQRRGSQTLLTMVPKEVHEDFGRSMKWIVLALCLMFHVSPMDGQRLAESEKNTLLSLYESTGGEEIGGDV